MRMVSSIFSYLMGFLMPRVVGVSLCALGGGTLGGMAWALLHETKLVGGDLMWFFVGGGALWFVSHNVSVIARTAEEEKR